MLASWAQGGSDKAALSTRISHLNGKVLLRVGADSQVINNPAGARHPQKSHPRANLHQACPMAAVHGYLRIGDPLAGCAATDFLCRYVGAGSALMSGRPFAYAYGKRVD